MTVYRHLTHALRIMRSEPDIQKWGPLIDALTPEQQAECRPWLRVQAKRILRNAHDQVSKASQPASLGNSSTRPRTTSRARKAART